MAHAISRPVHSVSSTLLEGSELDVIGACEVSVYRGQIFPPIWVSYDI